MLAIALYSAATPAQQLLTDHQRQVEKAGTALMLGVPAAALLATWVLDPVEGSAVAAEPHLLLMGGSPRHDLLLALARAGATTGLLKYAVDETRPNGGRYSFPSGHAAAAFTGAEFIRKEYGWSWAAPAYVAAGFVAWSRVEADKHYTHDVVAGAALGILANHDFWRVSTPMGKLDLGPGTVEFLGRDAPGLQFHLFR